MEIYKSDISKDIKQPVNHTGGGSGIYANQGEISVGGMNLATQTWIEDNYISKKFFDKLFLVHGDGITSIEPNDMSTAIESLEAKIGLWTNSYISALGQNSSQGGGSGTSYNRLDTWSSYDSTKSGWVLSALLGNDLNTRLTVLENGVAPISHTHNWSDITNTPTTLNGYGITDAYISNGVIRLGSQSIAPITSHQSLTGYATESWVGSNYSPKSHTHSIKINGVTKTIAATGGTAVDLGSYLPLNGGTMSNTNVVTNLNADLLDGLHSKDFSYAHQSDFAFNVAHHSNYVTFDKNNPDGAPASGIWYNGFVSTHNNYLSSYIVNVHRTQEWYVGFFDSRGDANPSWVSLVHSGNIGSQSVASATNDSDGNAINTTYLKRSGGSMTNTNVVTNLNADLLDGYRVTSGEEPWGTIPLIRAVDGVMKIGRYVDFNHDNSTGIDYSTRLCTTGNYSNTVNLPSASGTLALTSDNVASATKLQTARTLWGQNFDGTANVDGMLTGWTGCATNTTYTWSDGTNAHPWYGVDHRYPYTGVFSTTISDYFGLTLKTSKGIICMNSAGNVGIGTFAPTEKLEVNGNINTLGTVHATVGIYTEGYVSALGQNTSSDIRLKDVQGDVDLPIDMLANAPSKAFVWKENKALGEQVGTIAQYWQKALPQVVHDNNGYLAMQYDVTALLGVISLAKNVKSHEERIAELERENRELKKELKELKYERN